MKAVAAVNAMGWLTEKNMVLPSAVNPQAPTSCNQPQGHDGNDGIEAQVAGCCVKAIYPVSWVWSGMVHAVMLWRLEQLTPT
jgi:hypothetical protein